MSTSSRKYLFVPFVYWLLILLAGYLLMISVAGNGNGSGTGNGGQGALQENGTGASDNPEADGTGKNGTAETAVSAAEETSSADSSVPPAQPEKAVEESPKTEPSAPDKARDGSPKDEPADGHKPFEQAPEDLIPSLTQQEAKQQAPVREASKVIGLEEAKKGFFGVEVPSGERAVFLLDVSGSMYTPTADGISRMDLMKKIFASELNRIHLEARKERLKSKVGTFIFFTFSDDLHRYPQKGSYSYGSDQDIAEAMKHINELDTNAGGGTNMQLAFSRLQKILKVDFRCDMLYFLSDGEPSDCQPNELLAWLKKNMLSQKISTFALSTGSNLLKDIAKQHRGKHRQIR